MLRIALQLEVPINKLRSVVHCPTPPATRSSPCKCRSDSECERTPLRLIARIRNQVNTAEAVVSTALFLRYGAFAHETNLPLLASDRICAPRPHDKRIEPVLPALNPFRVVSFERGLSGFYSRWEQGTTTRRHFRCAFGKIQSSPSSRESPCCRRIGARHETYIYNS